MVFTISWENQAGTEINTQSNEASEGKMKKKYESLFE